MADVTEDLRSLLNYHLTGNPAFDRKSVHSERFLIDFLIEQVRLWEMGSMSYADLKAIFGEHNLGRFDLDQWVRDMAEAEEYFLPEELE